MTQTDDRQITEDLTHSQFEVMKAIPKTLVFMKINEPGTWRRDNGDRGYVVTTTMRALISKGFVKPRTDYTNGKRLPDITPAGYVAMSRAAHPQHKPKKRGR